jgi:glycosyltransferase involved in cell wall biosynthesis
MSRSLRIAVVIPWFGAELKGGAEQNAWQVATRLATRGHRVEVLTTACRSFLHNWRENHLPIGESTEEGVVIRRFGVHPVDHAAFGRANGNLLSVPKDLLAPGCPPVSEQDEHDFLREGIYSTTLLDFLRTGPAYDAVLGTPYLFGLVLDAVALAGKRGVLMPCLHHEAYAYLRTVRTVALGSRHLLFLSEGERELALDVFGPRIALSGTVVGAGVESPPSAQPEAGPPYLLCAGRRDRLKGVDDLVTAFKAARKPDGARLILIGPGEGTYDDPANGIHDLGLVDEARKWSLLHGCRALVNPSAHESFSRVIFESWLAGRPVIVNAACAATALAVRRGDGGWVAHGVEGLAAAIGESFAAGESALTALAANGAAFARGFASWDGVIDRIETVLAAVADGAATTPARPAAAPRQAVHQLLAGFAHGDAISNEALFFRSRLRNRGFASDIVANSIDPRVADEARRMAEVRFAPGDLLIYHHSIGDRAAETALAHRGPRLLIYHNITPAPMWQPYHPEIAKVLALGRDQLPGVATHFRLAACDSGYNAEEVRQLGCREAGVLPLPIGPAHWSEPPCHQTMRLLGDGSTNVLFVGRVAPNKRQDRIVDVFAAYARRNPAARLVLVGGYGRQELFYIKVAERIAHHGLQGRVHMPGNVPNDHLAACYATARVFLCLSEHEGFGVPLAESMWWDVPVIALRTTAVPETLGPAGILVDPDTDDGEIADMVEVMASDESLRSRTIAVQRRRRLDFLADTVGATFDRYVDRALADRAG